MIQDAKTIAQQIDAVRDYIVLGSISEDYFGKSPAWLSRKINGKGFNSGTTTEFTPEEKELFRGALLDIAEKLRTTALAIV